MNLLTIFQYILYNYFSVFVALSYVECGLATGWSVRRSLSRHALLTLVRAVIVSKVDYCNSVLAGIPCQLQDRLRPVLNAAAPLVFSARRSERITPLLRELY